MTPTVRFAPSPTGHIHIGNVRTAILNWLYAHKNGGTFILRLDDTDAERSKEEYAEGIRADLTWLGLVWQREERQSARMERYEAVAAELKRRGLLYPCFETEDELDRKRKRQMALGRPPIYDRSALKLTQTERNAIDAEGRKPHWRFMLPNTVKGSALTPQPTIVNWVDLIRGDQVVDIGSLSDPVLIRADGTFLYTLCSVIDDADMGVTHVIRGEDHVTNTGVQIAIFEAIGAVPPAFGHHSLLVGSDGQALSKRLGALAIKGMREKGLEPMAVASHAALVGTSDAIEPMPSLAALAALLDFDKISTAPGRFDLEDLDALNAKLLHKRDYADVADRLATLGIGGGAAFWEAVRGNLMVFSDAVKWWDIVSGDISPVVEDAGFLQTAAGVLPPEPWTSDTWKIWTDAVKASTGAKGKALFHPLRLALTGEESGPELKALLPLIGRERTLARLTGQTA